MRLLCLRLAEQGTAQQNKACPPRADVLIDEGLEIEEEDAVYIKASGPKGEVYEFYFPDNDARVRLPLLP